MSANRLTYKETLQVLNGMPRLREFTAEGGKKRLIKFAHYLKMAGIEVDDIDALNPIHIAGTKGKGSVSAMCESILKAHGYKTGVISSPHLIEARERIRINGKPISEEKFVQHFLDCDKRLNENCTIDEKKQITFFQFINVMSFKALLEEKVDVAIVEVGLGGAFCETNIIRHPKICGVTSLGYDHTDVLGKTMKEIAWHKAGIFKQDTLAFTAIQPSEGLEVIEERAKECQVSSVLMAPKYSTYPNPIMSLGIHGEHQFENASLAVQISKAWLNQMNPTASPYISSIKIGSLETSKGMNKENSESEDKHGANCGIPEANPFFLSNVFLKGLQDCHLPGRCHFLEKLGVSYFLDVAHTTKSLKYCAEWFEKASIEDANKYKDLTAIRVLLFYFSGNRDAESLLRPLSSLNIDHSLFTPNIMQVSTDVKLPSGLTEHPVARCKKNAMVWKQLHGKGTGTPGLTNEPMVYESISEALSWLDGIKTADSHLQVLVCGSFLLVGGVLQILGYDIDAIFF